MFEEKTILITGGTGSLGQELTKRLLENDVKAVRIFSRNESKQIEMENTIKDKRIRFFLGDIRDSDRLIKATEDVDIVFHAAALKHVPKIEYNPFEAIKTNVVGSQNVINACLLNNVEKVLCVGTDKAVSPLNTYGATKLLMEKLFVTANNYLSKDKYRTKFYAVRYGNVLGSSGSVIPLFVKQLKAKQKITITDPDMTRFSLSMNDALDFILKTVELSHGSEVFIPKARAYSILDVKHALEDLLGKHGEEVIGIRPGEKLHETLINEDEMRYCWEHNDVFLLANPLYSLFNDDAIKERYNGIKKNDDTKSYSSNTAEKISVEELKQIIQKQFSLD